MVLIEWESWHARITPAHEAPLNHNPYKYTRNDMTKYVT